MTRSLLVTVIAAVVVLGGVFMVMHSAAPSAPAGTQLSSAPAGATTEKTYALADVAVHGDESSCWTAINGNVYDLTAWVAQHPGGERAILSICGVDGSASFNGQHGSFEQAQQALAGFKIGVLAK